MKSIYSPFVPDGNPYVAIVQRAMNMHGIETVQLREAFKPGGARGIKAANFKEQVSSDKNIRRYT